MARADAITVARTTTSTIAAFPRRKRGVEERFWRAGFIGIFRACEV
jgi:hypothetical protein